MSDWQAPRRRRQAAIQAGSVGTRFRDLPGLLSLPFPNGSQVYVLPVMLWSSCGKGGGREEVQVGAAIVLEDGDLVGAVRRLLALTSSNRSAIDRVPSNGADATACDRSPPPSMLLRLSTKIVPLCEGLIIGLRRVGR